MVEDKTAIIGIDPGKLGFICIYLDGEYTFYPMPYHKVPTGEKLKSGKPKMKNEFHENGFRSLIFKINENFPNCKFIAAIEDVHGREGWSAQNNFNFGYVAGMQKMICIMLGAEIEMVKPQKWQSIMYKGFNKIMIPSSTGKTMDCDTKATSEMVAKKLGEGIDFRKTERSTTSDDNKTDAFLICEYKRRKVNFC